MSIFKGVLGYFCQFVNSFLLSEKENCEKRHKFGQKMGGNISKYGPDGHDLSLGSQGVGWGIVLYVLPVSVGKIRQLVFYRSGIVHRTFKND